MPCLSAGAKAEPAAASPAAPAPQKAIVTEIPEAAPVLEEPPEDGQVAGESAAEEFKRLLDEAEAAEADDGAQAEVCVRTEVGSLRYEAGVQHAKQVQNSGAKPKPLLGVSIRGHYTASQAGDPHY